MNKFEVAILTQNGIKNNKRNKLEDIVVTEPDIYVEFTQEDKRYFKNNPIIENEFIEKYTKIAENQSARPTTFTFGYNIVSKIFLNKSTFTNNIIDEIKKSIEYFVIYMDREGNILQHIPATSTKAAVCIKLNINNIQLLFINLHLPMLKKKEGLGVAERTKALKDLIEYLQDEYIAEPDTNMIIGGDLNFRMDEHGNDQLTYLIENTEIKEMKNDQNMFTCKFTNKLNNNNYDNLKQCRESDFTEGDFNEIQSEVQDSCGVHNRLPSKCDRFLIVEGYGTSITPIEYKAIYLENLKSDHNAVYSIFTIENNQSPRPKVTRSKNTRSKVTRSKVTRSKNTNKKGGLKNKKYTRRKYVK
jgi:hypothetical protein